MPERNGYGQFCPVSMAAEVFCSRWTPLILRELLAGTSRFNDLRRGVPRMSPALLSKRLKDLEKENQRLRKAVSDLTLDALILKEVVEGKY